MGHHSSYRISPSLWDCWNTATESPHCVCPLIDSFLDVLGLLVVQASDIFPFMAQFASFATNDSLSIPDLGSLPIGPRNGVMSQLNQVELLGATTVLTYLLGRHNSRR
jgi:hypothetical protein